MQKNVERHIAPADYRAALAIFDHQARTAPPSQSSRIFTGYPYRQHAQSCKRILAWFVDVSPFLSCKKAMRILGILDLPARIADLRDMGFLIHEVKFASKTASTRRHTSTCYALHNLGEHKRELDGRNTSVARYLSQTAWDVSYDPIAHQLLDKMQEATAVQFLSPVTSLKAAPLKLVPGTEVVHG